MNKKTAFITGNSSGLGKGLSQVLLNHDYRVYGCSRRGCNLQGDIVDQHCDLTRSETIPDNLEQLLNGVNRLDLVILNAGILGEIKNISDTSLDELRQIMEINLWPNKVILDWLLKSELNIDQILLMSSGAAVLGNKGWGGYALSKSGLNMLGRLYAHELGETHITAIAPGLIESTMMDYLCNEADSHAYPALQRIRQAREEGKTLTPTAAAERILKALPEIKGFESGSYIDLRQILAPDEYETLINARNRT
ncbi:MAG: SDR family NAD(P)-dependent oxidoreductase [Candidatus Thiodiazotropha weberae]|uniref:Alcohol dehydrogenase n=1 Tax=Candidatus Thiodiazotropha endoloripes TaxID=1818881 RepID=A0A1E2UGK1_9GAMM|nr:SDR family NAD(P)-dependent oxidoreductase [Candidatus Thiodiazotropha endoloripes]MCG7897430.1 SDR family NAD(P)-dependent oxidoreductase [Candidatus Thiodiazotropha weberae]MCG7915843.1 SDR family NAD(P)-dependent oxidoreductase [Candidatus Thiodiazotropha weberae]ODB82768.1 alcohol dehydrogenase [Candidatus Thiodiazotropha endoloripes]ODB82962.1 alcohol dehydrogenase [Candidatus Thiodiazotropha endoloripes]ODB91900.1 alcohol dehydrogenase [Candidatus Thiodiazotropha endoloripes]